jgi:hypothetical protein
MISEQVEVDVGVRRTPADQEKEVLVMRISKI